MIWEQQDQELQQRMNDLEQEFKEKEIFDKMKSEKQAKLEELRFVPLGKILKLVSRKNV